MKGKPHHFALPDEIPPTDPSQHGQKCKTAEAANYSCIGKKLHVIIVAVIHNEPVIHGFIRRVHFLQRAKSGSGDRMIEKNPPGAVQHFNAAPLGHLQGLVTGKALEGAAYAEPRHQGYGKNHDQARGHQFPACFSAEND